MNQELMTLDFWQDTVIYEGKTFPVGTLACDALNVPADTIAKANEQCEKINLLLGTLNAGQDACALCPMAREATLAMLDILSETPPFSYMDISKHRERIERVFTADNALKYVEFATKAATNSLQFEEIQNYAEAITLQRYTAVCGHLAYSLGEVSHTIKSTARRAGLKYWNEISCHGLRAGCATIMSDKGVPVATISKVLRHSSLTVTTRYIKANQDNVNNATALMEF